jgi:hypothetical protein
MKLVILFIIWDKKTAQLECIVQIKLFILKKSFLIKCQAEPHGS